jgi:hypothetical protein
MYPNPNKEKSLKNKCQITYIVDAGSRPGIDASPLFAPIQLKRSSLLFMHMHMTMRVPCKPSPDLPPYQQYSTAESRFRKLCCFTRVYKEPRPLGFDSESCNCGGGLRLADRCPMRALFPLVSISCGHWSRSPFTEVYTVAYPWGAVPARSAVSTIEVQISSDVAGAIRIRAAG